MAWYHFGNYVSQLFRKRNTPSIRQWLHQNRDILRLRVKSDCNVVIYLICRKWALLLKTHVYKSSHNCRLIHTTNFQTNQKRQSTFSSGRRQGALAIRHVTDAGQGELAIRHITPESTSRAAVRLEQITGDDLYLSRDIWLCSLIKRVQHDELLVIYF